MSENQEQKRVENEGQNDTQRVHGKGKNENKSKITRRVLSIVGAVVMVITSFLLGMTSVWFSLDSEMRTLITVKQRINKNYYEEVSDEHFYGVLFDAINEDVLDDYSEYLTAEELAALTSDLNGNRAGLGVVMSTQDANGNAQMLITRVCGNSPAEAAGITAGSYIVGFGATADTVVRSVSYDEFTLFLTDYDAGEKFYICITENGTEKTLEISREEYVENYVFYRSNQSAFAFTTGNNCKSVVAGKTLAHLDDDTAYIRIVQFTGNAAAAFDCAMEIFQQEGKKHLILDLRGNGGGYLDVMQSISSYFCKTATQAEPVVAIADYGKGKKEKFRAPANLYDKYFKTDSRIYLLADGDSASASECLIGCMLDYGAITYADICLTEYNGTAKTFGKGIMQTTEYLDIFKGDAIKLTTAKILWPLSENCIHDRGVTFDDGTKKVAQDFRGDNELINALNALLG